MNLAWSQADHCCRACGGRVLYRVSELTASRGGVYRCSTCPAEGIGDPSTICGCGIRSKSGRRAGGFKCGRNPQITHASPAEIIVFFGGKPELPGQR